MNVVILEDERIASEQLKLMLSILDDSITVIESFATVRKAADYFRQEPEIDLLFMDIQLADGLSFELFDEVNIEIPVIFITAFDNYAIQAFKQNSIDYLLKPIMQEDLEQAIKKYQKLHGVEKQQISIEAIKGAFESLQQSKVYPASLLVEKGEDLIPVKVEQFAYFIIENGVVKGVDVKNQKHHFFKTLDELFQLLNPTQFYRANRQSIVNKEAITKVSSYFHGRVVAYTQPQAEEQIIISKAKASEFKQWLAS